MSRSSSVATADDFMLDQDTFLFEQNKLINDFLEWIKYFNQFEDLHLENVIPQIENNTTKMMIYTKRVIYNEVWVTYEDQADDSRDHFVSAALLLAFDSLGGGQVASWCLHEWVGSLPDNFDLFASQKWLAQIFLHLLFQIPQLIDELVCLITIAHRIRVPKFLHFFRFLK